MGLRCRRGSGGSFWFDFFGVLGFVWGLWISVFDMGYVDTDNDLGIGMGLAFLVIRALSIWIRDNKWWGIGCF